MKLSALAIDTDKSVNGVWAKYDGDIEVLIAQTGNPEYQGFLTKLVTQNAEQLRDEEDDSTMDNILRICAGRKLIRGWKNVQDDEGVDIPFTEDLGEQTMLDPAFSEFYQWVTIQAGKRQSYRRKVDKDTEGN